MPIVTFIPSSKSEDVPAGTSLYDAAQRAGLPVASSCSAEATCGKCNMRVIGNEAGLSPRNMLEDRLLKKERKPPTDRISCLTLVTGDCTVTTSYW